MFPRRAVWCCALGLAASCTAGSLFNDIDNEDECGVLWPQDPFHAAIYSFIAEYALGFGAIVGCFDNDYPDQTFEWVALDLENNWHGTGSANAVGYAQEWVDSSSETNGQRVFNLIETFQLTIEGSSVSGGLGFEEGGRVDDVAGEQAIEPGEENVSGVPHFKIEESPHTAKPGMKYMTRYVEVFGLGVVAESGLTNAQVLHAASVLAELLDNDEDGIADDPELLSRLQQVDALVPMFNKDGSAAYKDFESHYQGQGVSAVLFADEVDPSQAGHWGTDATVEEIMHTINHRGHVSVYPAAFGLEPNSSLLTEAMDAARSGQFMSVPESYPEKAWYHYDDTTCDYQCMAIEYIYWAQVSNMGILDDPLTCARISNEWEPCSKDLLEVMDPLVYALVTDPKYKLPQSAPDGVYPWRRPTPVRAHGKLPTIWADLKGGS